MKEISVIIPVYNSEENLVELNRQVTDALQNFNYELILINDCSRDNSWDVIYNLANTNKNITGINLRKNSGQDNAIMAGLSLATGQYIVIMDDDLQHSPYDICKLLAKCKEGYDVCYAMFPTKKQAWWKNFGSWLNGKMAEIIIEKPKGVYLSPFEIFTNEICSEIIKYDGPYPYVQGLILRATSNFVQIPIEHHKRFKGSGNFNFIRSLTVFLKLMTSFSIAPLRLASYVGFFSSFSGFVLVLFYIFKYFSSDKPFIEGWMTLVVLFLIIGGLVLISLGIIGEYIGRMYLNINKKPQYVIKQIYKQNA